MDPQSESDAECTKMHVMCGASAGLAQESFIATISRKRSESELTEPCADFSKLSLEFETAEAFVLIRGRIVIRIWRRQVETGRGAAPWVCK